jgi:hypothetical protein
MVCFASTEHRTGGRVIDNRVDAKIHQWCGALVGGFEPGADVISEKGDGSLVPDTDIEMPDGRLPGQA